MENTIIPVINFITNKNNILYRSMFKNFKFENALDISISYARLKLQVNLSQFTFQQEHKKLKK